MKTENYRDIFRFFSQSGNRQTDTQRNVIACIVGDNYLKTYHSSPSAGLG